MQEKRKEGSYIEASLKRYLQDLSSDLPAPGGGSASSLTGALGASLLCMAANFTLGREEFSGVQDRVKGSLRKCENIRKGLEELADEDVKAYSLISRAYGLPRGTDSEKKERTDSIQAALLEAMGVPWKTAILCRQGLELAMELADICNPRLVSDVGVAAVFLEAALRGAELNVRINLGSIKDKGFVEKKTREWEGISSGVEEMKRSVWEKTLERM